MELISDSIEDVLIVSLSVLIENAHIFADSHHFHNKCPLPSDAIKTNSTSHREKGSKFFCHFSFTRSSVFLVKALNIIQSYKVWFVSPMIDQFELSAVYA